MFNKATDRSTWVIQREYQDSEGIVQTEYRDSLGNTHIEAKDPNQQAKSYQNGYVDGVLLENRSQNAQLKREEIADRKVSRGLLVGLIIASVVGITGALAYYLFQVNNPSPVTVVTTPIYKTEPAPSPSLPVVEKSGTNITSAQPAKPEPQDLNVTIKTESEAPKPVVAASTKVTPKVVQPVKPATTAVKAPVQPTPAIAPPSSQAKPIASMPPVMSPSNAPSTNTLPSPIKTDVRLKTEIVQELNRQFSGNQLLVEVNQGNVKISGAVNSPEQLEKIEPLLRSMAGVNTINVKVNLKLSSN